MITKKRLTHLRQLEAESIHILREVTAEFTNPFMMYSVGKDSSVMLHLAMKAFAPSKLPFPLLHVDPIDGTKEFIKKNGEFTVNIALIHNDTPVLGVVYAPALGDMYKAKKGNGAFKNDQQLPLEVNKTPEKSLKVVASKSHLSEETQAFIDEVAKGTENIEQVSKGSSLKLVMVAEDSADIYPRLAPTMEWDTAAADAVVRESGKITYQFENEKSVVYNKENLLNPWFIVKD